jgi:myosin-5
VQFGLTKLFLRAGVVAQFENMRTQKLNNSAVAVQKHWKRFYYQRRYKQLRIASVFVQTCKLVVGKRERRRGREEELVRKEKVRQKEF